MKKLLIFLLPALMMVACGKKTQSTSANTDSTKVDSAKVQDSQNGSFGDAEDKALISGVINNVYKIYTDDNAHYSPIDKYGSAELRKLYNQGGGNDPDEKPVDCNIYSGSRDYTSVTWKIKSVSFNSDGSAKVIVDVADDGEPDGQKTYIMVNENGKWLVDDIYNTEDGKSWGFKEYLKNPDN